MQQEQERLLDGQSLLNQREEYVASKSQELNQLEKVLEVSKANIEKELRSLNDEKSNLELTAASLSQREEVGIFKYYCWCELYYFSCCCTHLRFLLSAHRLLLRGKLY